MLRTAASAAGPRECADRAHPPRRHLRRRLRVAARQGVAGDGGPPRGRERLHRDPHRAPGRAARGRSSPRSRAAPRRPTCRSPTGWATGGTTAARHEDKQYGASCRCPGARPRRLDPADSSRPTSRSPASRSCRRGRAGRGPRVLLPRRRVRHPGRPPARLQHRHRRRRALPAAGQGPAHRRAAARRGAEHPRRRAPGTGTGSTLFYTTVDDAWRPDKMWRHVLGTPVADDVVVHHETDERFWRGRGPHPQRPVPLRRVSGRRPPRSTPSSTPTTRPATSASSHPAAGASSTPSSTR